MSEASPSCVGCLFYVGKNECQLPTGKPTASIKSAREHYRSYFRRPCVRKIKPVSIPSGALESKSEGADISSPGVNR